MPQLCSTTMGHTILACIQHHDKIHCISLRPTPHSTLGSFPPPFVSDLLGGLLCLFYGDSTEGILRIAHVRIYNNQYIIPGCLILCSLS